MERVISYVQPLANWVFVCKGGTPTCKGMMMIMEMLMMSGIYIQSIFFTFCFVEKSQNLKMRKVRKEKCGPCLRFLFLMHRNFLPVIGFCLGMMFFI